MDLNIIYLFFFILIFICGAWWLFMSIVNSMTEVLKSAPDKVIDHITDRVIKRLDTKK